MNAERLSEAFQFGPFHLSRRRGGLFRQKEDGALAPIDIGSRAFDVLCALIERHGELVEKDELMAVVWPDVVVTAANLTVHISALRRVLGVSETGTSWIQTVPGRGYRFIGSVIRPSPTERRQAALVPRVTAATPSTPTSTPRWWVGRTTPLQALCRLLSEAGGGSRQVVFVTGEAGIGKTTLIEMATQLVSREGSGVLWGRCVEMFGIEEAFLPLIDALMEACRGPKGNHVLQALRDHAPTWLLQLPGSLNASDRAAVQEQIFGATRERMLREFCELLEVLSAEGLWIVVLEDLHWSDSATVNALSRFARGLRPAAVLVLASYRPNDAVAGERPVRILHQDLQLHGQATELVLDRLSAAEVEHYLALRFGNGDLASTLATHVFARTRGQPLFVTSLVDYFVDQQIIVNVAGGWRVVAGDALWQDGIPSNLRNMIMRQIDQLVPEEQRLLEVASAAGTEFAAALVAAGIAGDVLEVERIFERLSRQGHIMTTTGTSEWPDGTFSGSYSFQHALYQEVLYARLSPAQRVQAHRRLGARLEEGYGVGAANIAPVLARHFEEGREFGRAVRYLGEAATSSAKRLGNNEAANYLSRALALVDRFAKPDQLNVRITLLRQRSWVRRTLGDLAGSLDDLNALITLAAEAGELRLEVNGLLALSRFCLHADRRLCLEATERAVARSHSIDDRALQFLVRATSASTNLYLRGWRPEDAEVCLQAMSVTADARDHGTLIRRYGIESILECSRSRYIECRIAATQGKALARAAGDIYTFVLFNVMEATALLHLGEWRVLQRETAAALALAERNANRPAKALCQLTLAWLHVEALDFEGARNRCEAVEDRVFEDNPFAFFFQRAVLAKAFVGLRNYEQAARQFEAIDRKLQIDGGSLDFTIYTQLCHCRCEHGLEVADVAEAREQAALLYEYAAPAPDRNHLALAHQLRARIAVADGDIVEAESQLCLAVAMLGSPPPPLAAWRVYHTAAEFYASLGRADVAAAFQDRFGATLRTLAANFDVEEPLQASLLGAVTRVYPTA